MPSNMDQKTLSCGRDLHICTDLNNSLDECCRQGYDFVCVPIVNPRFRREFVEGPALNRPGALTRSDLLLTSQDWSVLIVAKISPWLQLNSKNDVIRKNSEEAFRQELVFASHLSVPAILLPLNGPNSVNMVRLVNEHIIKGHNHQYWVQVPMKSSEDSCDDVIEGRDVSESEWTHDTWKWWSDFHALCDSSKKLGLALEITSDLPNEDVINRWCGESIKAAIINTSVFMTNKKGFPVLSKAHQNVVKRMFRLDVQMIISGCNRHGDRGIKTYQQYLDHLWDSKDPLDNVAKFAKGYEDYLQCPLQPLMDNLESQTYEVFEKDPVKYSQYQKAVYYALLDRVLPEDKDRTTVVIMVLGAGRGPLVTASINAARKADRRVKLYAIEKNPNAVVTLENLRYEMWGDQVTVVSCDMRHWEAPEKADIIVSELLGSFGDNELSPECLDGGQMFLKDDGISIPREYTSYVTPLSSSKLWNETRQCKDPNKGPDSAFETPYVVRLHNVNILGQAKPLFTFTHPNRGIIDNSRYDSLDFDMAVDTVLHGFGGYFECYLYADITISIVPETHSPGMFSWFPVYFPIKQPMHLKAGDRLTVHFWRVCSPKNTWYEWCITSPKTQAIHNPKGRSYTIGL